MNRAHIAHTVTFTDGLRIPADNGTFNKRVESGASVTWSFPASGTYAFFCMIHPDAAHRDRRRAVSERLR